jgi:hypothetical protein
MPGTLQPQNQSEMLYLNTEPLGESTAKWTWGRYGSSEHNCVEMDWTGSVYGQCWALVAVIMNLSLQVTHYRCELKSRSPSSSKRVETIHAQELWSGKQAETNCGENDHLRGRGAGRTNLLWFVKAKCRIRVGGWMEMAQYGVLWWTMALALLNLGSCYQRLKTAYEAVIACIGWGRLANTLAELNA